MTFKVIKVCEEDIKDITLNPSTRDVEEMGAIEILAELHSIQNISDAIYDVREQASGQLEEYEGSNWDIPVVLRYGELAGRAVSLIKEHEMDAARGG